MGFQVSPGVQVKEVDLTNVIPAVSTSIGAFAGHFSWGPVGETRTVSSEKELADVYGVPTGTDSGAVYDNYIPFLQAASFLKYGNALVVSRAIDATARNAVGSAHGTTTDVHSSYIGNKDTFDGIAFSINDGNSPSSAINAAVVHARCPGRLGNSLKVFIANAQITPSGRSAGQFSLDALNSNVSSAASTTAFATANVSGTTHDEIHVAVIDEDGLITGTKNTVLEIFEGLSLYSDATKDGGSNYYKTVINRDSEYIFIVESVFKEYFRSTVDGADKALPGEVSTTGKLFSSNLATASRIATGAEADTDALTIAISETANNIVNGTYTVVDNQDDSNIFNSPASNNGSGAKFTITVAGSAGSRSASDITVTVVDGGFQYAAGDVIQIKGQALGAANNTDSITLTVKAAADDLDNADLFDFSLVNGTDGASGVAHAADHVVTALGQFDDPEKLDINLLFAEQFNSENTIGLEIIRVAGTARKDCVGFISADRDSDSASDVTSDHSSYSSSYVVLDSSAVYVYNKYRDDFVYINASGHVAGLCARTDSTNDAWFSPAGYNRGNLLGVTKLKYNPNKTDRDTLYKAGVNPIIAQPGQGILLFGDKTAQSKPSAFDRINVRRLFVTVEKAIATAAKFQLFELNDEFTRAMFRNMVEPFLRDVKGRRGITDFIVVCDETNNTGDIIDTNRFVADIYIKPARSINFITLNFVATRTGIEFSEIVGTGN